MKIDVTKIEGYENMTAEEKLAALENFDIEEKPNDESKWKSALDKATAEAAKYKKELREKQTESERLEAERAEKDKAGCHRSQRERGCRPEKEILWTRGRTL